MAEIDLEEAIEETEEASTSPVSPYRWVVLDSGNNRYLNKVLIGTAVTGLVRVEWVQARYGQIIPPSWSHVEIMSYFDSYMPLRFQVPDAQNLIVKQAVEGGFEWCLLLEHDTCLPPLGLVTFNQYMDPDNPIAPIVSGLYYTRSRPSVPLVFRGRGAGAYMNWKLGDQVWCDGVPTGCLLIHTPILTAMWNDSEEYTVRDQKVRRVFRVPYEMECSTLDNIWSALTGTTDLDWCTRVIEGDYIKKAGWTEFAKKHRKYPLLIDTEIFCRHVNPSGEMFP